MDTEKTSHGLKTIRTKGRYNHKMDIDSALSVDESINTTDILGALGRRTTVKPIRRNKVIKQ